MSFLRLLNLKSGDVHEFERTEILIGRDPEVELVISGQGAEVVSGRHARIVYRDGRWQIEDLGSRNGTFLNDRRLVPGAIQPLTTGAVIRFGERGPRLRVEAVVRRTLEETLDEGPTGVRPSAPTMPLSGVDSAPAAEPLRVVLMETRSGEQYQATGSRLRVGRGKVCELRPVVPEDTSVSRVHAEIVLKPDGQVVLRDAQSRNGTFLNGQRLTAEQEIKRGDHMKLGESGLELVVATLATPKQPTTDPAPPSQKPSTEPHKPSAAARAAEKLSGERRSFGGKGATVFFKQMFDETARISSKRIRWLVWSFVVILIGGVGGLYWYYDQQVRATTEQLAQLAAQQAVADSVRRAAQLEVDRLRSALDQAMAESAPAAEVESLRVALVAAGERTAALEAALERAQVALKDQLAAGESLRKQAESELARLRVDLNRASASAGSAGLLDSLRQAVEAAEQRAAAIESQVRAVQGVDLSSVAQANQSAIGLVTAYFGNEVFDGSGFAVTPSGYFVTNRHVVAYRGRQPDSLYVTMADQRLMKRSDLVNQAHSGGPDLAVIKIRSHDGSYVPRVDWSGTKVRQGEPAALIGFPAGLANALDENRTVRTSMSAGIFSKVTSQVINYDGFTVGGSSGSPIFNAMGEVVAVHRAGLAEATGLSFAVPIRHLIPLLPPQARAELGLR